ncbi:MAG: glycoside hydrolase [Aquimonas sp.]|nr:glycoside hydrolase [Aquimonas sp.]
MVRTQLAAPFLALSAAIGLSTQAASAPAASDPIPRLQVLHWPTEQAALTPSLTADHRAGRFLLSWQERLPAGCARLMLATISLDGAGGESREVARGCDWFVNWADHPRMAVADNGDWLGFWLQKEGPGTYHYGIRVVRSQDEGRSWSAPLTPHDDGTLSEHGFVSLAAAGEDRMLMIWLDGRYTAGGGDHGHDHSGHEGPMSLRAAVLRRDGSIEAPAEIDARVCSCCPTALLREADGRHLAVWRDRSEHEVRDIAFGRRDARGWRGLGLVHADNWRIEACPVNGPALALQSRRPVVAWSTMPDARSMSVQLRALDDRSAPLTLEEGPGVLGRVALAPFGKGVLAAWLGSGAPGESVLRLALLDAELKERTRMDVVTLPAGRAIGMPSLAALGEVGVLAWTEPDPKQPGKTALQVRRIEAARP